MATMIVEGRRVYITTVYGEACVQALKDLGAKWDPETKRWWVGAAKKPQVEEVINKAASIPESPDEPDSARCYAKVKYKDSTYFVIAEVADKGKCKICRLSGKSFWVDMADCELLKTYQGREEKGVYGRSTGRTIYTTLGSIRAFIKDQKDAEAQGQEPCTACGKRGKLHHDMEDGLMKCFSCCDMPE